MPKVTHVELDVLFVRVYDAIAHFYNDEKAVLDIMNLLKIDPGYYTTKCCGSLNMRRKLSSIYRFLEQRRKKWLYEVNLAAMKSACVALTYHIGYHNNCIKSADTWCQYQRINKTTPTQNANESFSGTIWNHVPKVTHVGLDVLFVRVYDAIAHFYNGEKAVLDIIDLLKIDPGYYTTVLWISQYAS